MLVENFRPGVTERFGLHYEAVRAANPRIVYCSITGFGRGEGAALPGYDLLIQVLGGLMSITGSPEGEPQKVGVALVDVLAGLFSTVGILAALEYRRDSGKGQRIEVDLLSSLLAGLVNQASAYTVAGVVPGWATSTRVSPRTSFSLVPTGSSCSLSATIASSPRCARSWTRPGSRVILGSRRTPRGWRTATPSVPRSATV